MSQFSIRSLRHAGMIGILTLSGMLLSTNATAQSAADLAALPPDQIAARVAAIPTEQLSAFAAQLTPVQVQALMIAIPPQKAQEILAQLPQDKADAIKKLLQQQQAKTAANSAIPPMPKGKPSKLYIRLNDMVIEAVSPEQEKAKALERDELVKQGQSPYFGDGKYLPGLFEFSYVPAGSFLMGSNASEAGRLADEQRHEVQLSKPFWMSCFEVTQEQWAAIMGRNSSSVTLPPPAGTMEIPTFRRGAGYPMFNITQEEAQQFCRRLTELYRHAAQNQKTGFKLPENMEFALPTEAQWEYACRAGSQTPFASGEVLLARDANYNLVTIKRQIIETVKNNEGEFGGPRDMDGGQGQKPKTTIKTIEQPYNPVVHVVGVGNANAFGLFDMHGNVWEWCKGYYYSYTNYKVTDPQGMRSGTMNVARGGGWYSLSRDCRSARRLDIDGSTRQDNIGFRVVIVEK